MRKSFMNLKHFVDSNVRHRIEKANNGSDSITDDLALVERQFEDLRKLCVEAEKRISTMLQSIGSSTRSTYTQSVQASLTNLPQLTANSSIQASSTDSQRPIRNFAESCISTTIAYSANKSSNHLQADSGQSIDGAELDIKKHKKLPIVGFLKFLVKSCHKLRQDSLLATTLTHCSHLQAQLTKLYMSYERTIESQCLKPIQQVLETDIPNVIKLRKSFIKAHNDLESVRVRYNGASQKQQQPLTAHFTSATYTIAQNSSLQANANKLDLLKRELEDAETWLEQAKDSYAIELYTFVCRETELVELLMRFYQHQAEYQAQSSLLIRNSLPSLSNTLATTPRRVAFGTPLSEHLKCTGRSVSVIVELCIHLLYSNALDEQGLFRIPGGSVKIKKLKSAINAWFVTLATHNELVESQDYEIIHKHNKTQHPTLLAIYGLFKDIVGQLPPQKRIGAESNHNTVQTAITTRDESSQSYTDLTVADRDTRELLFDVHTVAGLLKLYLRELPEPLLGDDLYDQWIDAGAKYSDANKTELADSLRRVVELLPKPNYDNLRLLIRFLHLLTCHHEKNKMTATNLAITMAPSLIRVPKKHLHELDTGSCVPDDNQHLDEAQVLNMQMSSMGLSASLHALVTENLINHAEQLFPGEISFELTNLELDPVMTHGYKIGSFAKDRPVKSTSPTGSSTESTSSFSSISNVSNSKKSGSTDGLAPNNDDSCHAPTRPARPASVCMNQYDSGKRHAKPPVPPAPPVRSHARQASDSLPPQRNAFDDNNNKQVKNTRLDCKRTVL